MKIKHHRPLFSKILNLSLCMGMSDGEVGYTERGKLAQTWDMSMAISTAVCLLGRSLCRPYQDLYAPHFYMK